MSRAALLKADPHAASGCLLRVAAPHSGLAKAGLEFHRLAVGQHLEFSSDEQEACVVLLSGSADARAGDHEWTDIGARQNLFDGGRPHALYLPCESRLSLLALAQKNGLSYK